MDIRPAHDGDLQGIAVARLSNGSAHHDSGANPDYCRFLMGCGHLWVAVDGDVIGFGGAVDIGPARLLSDLYVRNDAHGRGVGSALLRAVLDGAASTFTFASSRPAAQAIYARAGMVATWSLATMHGRVDDLGPTDLVAEEIGVDEAVRFESTRLGYDHGQVMRYWASRPGNRIASVADDRAVRGVAVVHVDDGVTRVEHMLADTEFATGAFAAAVLATGASNLEAYVPETRRLFADLLLRDFEVTDRSMFMTSRPGVVHDDLQVVHPGLC